MSWGPGTSLLTPPWRRGVLGDQKDRQLVLGRPFIFSGIVDLPKTQKTVEQIFDLGPGFWATARNRPKMAQNLKIELLPQFYSQDSPLFRL